MSDLIRGERPALTTAEQLLRTAAALLGLASAGFALWYLAKGLFDDAEFPFVVNSVAKDVLLAGLCLLVVWDVRRWAAVAVPLIALAHLALAGVLGLTWAFGDGDAIDDTWIGPPSSGTQFRITWLVAALAIAVALVVLHRRALRARYDIRYLPPSGFRAVMALAEILVLRKDREIGAAEVAGRVDHYLASFRAQEKWKIRLAVLALAYWPLLTLRPPFWLMSIDLRQRWVQRRFIDDVAERAVPEWLRTLRQAMIRAVQQLCFLGYYGDPRAAERVGYLPFSRRPGFEQALARVPRDRPGVACMAPEEIRGETLTADIVVVGTGAAGATLAYELARRRREVLMLERGPHIDPREFTEDEAVQLSNLYADGALTLAKDFRFQVAQGMCVGGSTVVNNAVCIPLPPDVLERWRDEHAAGLDPARLARAFDDMKAFLRVAPVRPEGVLNPGAKRILEGLDGAGPGPFTLVDCNIDDCLGSGYCNIGCPYGKKLSALDWTLPRVQREFPGAVRILPDCRVEKIVMRGARASGVRARLGDGRRLTVRADTVVVSAGALASSVILQRSGLGEGRAGTGIAFNMASPVTFDFAEELHSERGLQITHVMRPADGRHEDLLFETWFNPVISQALFMPGWFEEHWDNMRRYAHMTCLGTVVGSGNDGRVKATRRGGLALDYTPSDADFVRLKAGVRLACEIGLLAGAERVMPATFRPMDLRHERELRRIDEEIGDAGDVSVNSAHPQGGNPLSADPLRGVVDPSFRVYGTLNVHVCDASVFPTSITVNPQLTVMALASYAADEIAGPAPARPVGADQLAGSRSHGAASGPGS